MTTPQSLAFIAVVFTASLGGGVVLCKLIQRMRILERK